MAEDAPCCRINEPTQCVNTASALTTAQHGKGELRWLNLTLRSFRLLFQRR
jgi:hypothetical protein